MPPSRSPSRPANPPPRRSLGPTLLVGVLVLLAVLAAVVFSLPASMISHFLPPMLRADDFSGSIWHGSAAKMMINGQDAGAIEWRLHPVSLLTLGVLADLHWVKEGFVIDGSVRADRHGVTAQRLQGGGPIEDLRDLGVPPGWHGRATLDFAELSADTRNLTSAVGQINVSGIASPKFVGGADLGGYQLKFGDGAIAADGTITGALTDTGGPAELLAQLRFTPSSRVGLISGTVLERPQAPQAIRDQLSSLAQYRPRDSAGRIPIDFEFAL
jgi:Type II secretion system (T2SS), protein N